jgi:hypothetical protein
VTKRGRCLWLKPLILASWEAEIGKMEVGDQSRQKIPNSPSQPIPGHNDAYLFSEATWEVEIRRMKSRRLQEA